MDIELLKQIDAYVLRTSPVVVVPRAEPLAPLTEPGHRYLVGEGGLYMEFRRVWCHGTVLLAASGLALPFGQVKAPQFELTCGRLPGAQIRRFVERARAVYPLETAAWITWNEHALPHQDPWALIDLPASSASGDHVTFERPLLAPGQHLVLDIHSHGRHAAYFSKQDDEDDKDQSVVKLAAVVGNLANPEMSSCMRLCAQGFYQPIGGLNEVRLSDL